MAKTVVFPVITGETRYTCNGVLTIDGTPGALLSGLLSSMDGEAIYAQGQWSLWAGGPATPEADVIDESWLNGGISFKLGSNKNEKYNTASGTYTNPSDHWADSGMPSVVVPAYVTEDQEELTIDLQMPFCTSGFQAQRQARLAIERSRCGLIVDYPCNLKALKVKVNEVYKISNDLLGWHEKLFRVMDWQFSTGGGINLTLGFENPAIYTVNVSDMNPLPTPDLTDLPTPWIVPAPTGLTAVQSLYATNVASEIKVQVALTWTQPSVGISRFEVEQAGYFSALVDETGTTLLDETGAVVGFGDAGWVPAGVRAVESTIIYDVSPGLHSFRVRAVNGLNVPSPWATISITVYGKLNLPANVLGLSAVLNQNIMQLSWLHTADIDRDHYEIRLGVSWALGVEIGRTPANKWTYQPTSSGNNIFWLKCIDTTGNESATAASASVTLPAAVIPTAITGQSVLGGIDVTIVYPQTPDIDYCEIWAATINDRASAAIIGITRDGKYLHNGLPNASVRYYWVRTRNVFTEYSGWYPSSPTAGVMAMTMSSPSTLMGLLTGALTIDELTANLKRLFKFGKIGGVDTLGLDGALVVDGSITATAIDTDTLLIGDNIFMAPGATISWADIGGVGKPANNADVTNYLDTRIANSALPTIYTQAQINGFATTITNSMVTTAFVNALNVKAGSVDVENLTGTTITGKTIQTSQSGERFEMSMASARGQFFDSNDHLQISIGTGTLGTGVSALGSFGNGSWPTAGVSGIYAYSQDARGVYGYSESGYGIYGASPTGTGVAGVSTTEYGMACAGGLAGISASANTDPNNLGYGAVLNGSEFRSGNIWYTNKAPLRLIPSISSLAPTHIADSGAIWLTSLGHLYINRTGGTTWTLIS